MRWCDSPWTEERVATLKELHGLGKQPKDIAAALGDGITSNAVIGKAHRLELSWREPTKKGVVCMRSVSVEKCEYHLGQPLEDYRPCGKEVKPGSPYCPEHNVLAHRGVAAKDDLDGDVRSVA